MTNKKFDDFKSRLQHVLTQVDLPGDFPLKEFLTKEAFKKIVTDLLNNHNNAEQFQTFEAERIFKNTELERTHHITVNEEGEFFAILDTKGKTPTGDKKDRTMAVGAKKTVKPSFRIDVWPPEDYVSAVSYGPADVKLARKEIQSSVKLKTPFHQSLLISADYAHENKGVACSIFSIKRDVLSENLKTLNYISRYVIAFFSGLISL